MKARLNGRLALVFDCGASGQTVLHVREQQPPLKVIRAFDLPGGAALVHLHNISGGVLGGDQLELDVRVHSGARAQITTAGATRLYRRAADRSAATQRTVIHVEADAQLEMLPDALIPFAGSAYQQQTTVTLGMDAGLFWWESVAPGRDARGEHFAYERLSLNTEISVEGQPVALEAICLEPQRRPLSSGFRLGRFTHFATFYICRVGLSTSCWAALEVEMMTLATALNSPQTQWGVSTLVAHGLIVRGVSLGSHPLNSGLFAFWDAASRALYNRPAIAPRKVY